ncbi:hypothetical protein B566_EDAN009279 [Ephemera danica]|nr:hypothetical protein B566_EDAN009279 [Ephemera danica]
MSSEEVLEDKKNADSISALATTLDSAKPKIPPFVKKSVDKPPRERPLRTRPFLQQPAMKQEMEQRTGNTSKMYSNFADGDGPPPDPRYSFLADDERDEQRTEVKNDPTKSVKISKKGKEGNNTGPHSKMRNNPGKKQSSRGRGANWNTPVQKNSNEEKWRAERAAIDAERIQRQKTQEGNWRREWDVEKASKELEDSTLKSSKGYQPSYKSKTKFEGGSLSWRNNSSNEAQERQSDSYPHTMIFNRNREKPVVFKTPQFRDGGHDMGTKNVMVLNGEKIQVRTPHDSMSDSQSSSILPESCTSSKYSSFSVASSDMSTNPKHHIGTKQLYGDFHSDYSSMEHDSVQVDPEFVERFSNIQIPHSPSGVHYTRAEDANKMTFDRNTRDLTHEEDRGEESWEDVSEDEKCKPES